MSLDVVVTRLLQLLPGIPLTLELVALALLFGLAIGCFTAFARLSGIPGLTQAAYFYVYVIRGTPLLLQVFLVYYGLGQIEWLQESFLWPVLREEFWCAIIALSINSGAYTSEVIRGGLRSIDHGQIEAALAFGMTRWTRLAHIIVPQAVRQLLPAYGNECIALIKASALASTITLMEVTGLARNIAATTFTPIETFVAAGIIYLALNYAIIKALGGAEARFAIPSR